MRYAILILFLLVANIASPQSRISGTVKDASTSATIGGVVVSAYSNNTIKGYTVSGTDGRYSINLNSSCTHLVFTHLGYNAQRLTINPNLLGEGETVKDILLTEDVRQLKSITVKPVAVKVAQDTVTYNVTSFAKREDRTLEQVLARLPDVKVTSTGSVYINGRTINKLYIEDMDMLGGRYGIAVKNIRVEDISAINVYHNHQPVKALRESEPSYQHAVNVKLKEKAKSRWLIALAMEAGAESNGDMLYAAKANAMNFSPKTQTIVTAKSNNAGNDIITETQLQNLKPGVYRLDELQNIISDLFSVPATVLPIEKSFYFNNNSNAVTFSHLRKTGTDASIKGNIIFTAEQTKNNTFIERTTTTQNSGNIFISDSSLLERNNIGITADIAYILNSNRKHLENILTLKVCMDDASSRINGMSATYKQAYDLPKYEISNQFNLVVNRGNKRAFRLNSKFGFTNLSQQMEVKLNPDSSRLGTECLIQDINARRFKGDINTKFMLSGRNATFAITPGIDFLYNRYESVFSPAAENTVNNLWLFSLTPYITPEITFTGRKIEFGIAVPLHLRYDITNSNNNIHLLYKPHARVEYKISPSLKFNAYSSLNKNMGGIESMAQNYIYCGYRDFKAYRKLEETESFSAGGGFTYNNLGKLFSASIRGNHSVLKSNIMPWETITSDFTYMIYDSGNNKTVSNSISINARKLFGINKFSIEAGAVMSNDKGEQFLQDNLYKYRSKGISANIGLEYSPLDALTMEYSADCSKNTFTGEGPKSNIRSFTHKASLTVYPIKQLQLGCNMTAFTQKGTGTENISLVFVNVSAECSINKKVKAFARLQNITDRKYYQYTYYSTVSTVTRRVALRGAEYLVGISFDL